MSVDAIFEQVQALSAEEREELLDRIEEKYSEGDAEISDELKALLDERDADAEANPGVGFTIEEVMDHLKSRKR